MKKTINVAIGGCSFTIDEDAYNTLNNYLERFKAALDKSSSSSDVLDELEVRIADMLKGKLGGRQVVDQTMTLAVIGQLGYPEGYSETDDQGNGAGTQQDAPHDEYHYSGTDGERPVRKLFRNPDDKRIAGVCSGIALFLGVDVTLIRILFLVGLICGSAGFWIYLVIWIAAPEAKTAAEKCELRGIPANAENIRRFTEGR